MLKHRDRTWVALIVLGIGLLIAAGLGLFGYIAFTATPLHPNPQDVPSVTHSAPSPTVGRRGRAGAADRPRQRHRAEPAGTLGGGRRRRRHRVGRRLRLGGSREARARRARDAVQDRHRLHGAHVGRGRPAAGEGPAEARRRDSGLRACVPEEAVARDAAPVDGASWPASGTTAATKGRCSRSTASGRSTRCSTSRSSPLLFEPGTRVPLFELRLDPGERGRRSRRGRAVPHVHAEADLRAAGHGRHEGRLRDGADPGSGDAPTSRGSRRIPATART